MATTTTRPSVTMPPTNSTRATTVNSIEVKDYQELRMDNFNKISNYYNQIFKTYKDKNEIYQRDRTNFSDRDARAYAETVLKKQVDDYQNQIFNIYNEMINLLKKNDEIILAQKTDVEKIKKETDKLDAQIKQLKTKEDAITVDSSGHESNKAKIQKAIDDEKDKYRIYFGICLFIGFFIVILIAYLIWRPVPLESSLIPIGLPQTSNQTNSKNTNKTNTNNKTNSASNSINNSASNSITNNKNTSNLSKNIVNSK